MSRDAREVAEDAESRITRAGSGGRCRLPLRPLLSIVVVGLWSAMVIASLAGGWQLVGQSSAVRDVADGRITSYALVESRPDISGAGGWWTDPRSELVDANGSQDSDVELIYTLADGRPRIAVPGHVDPTPTMWGTWSEQELAWIQQEFVESQIPAGTVNLDLGRTERVHTVLALVLAGGMLALVVAGPVPRHGNRWFWFWLIGLPGGLGVVAYAIWELGGWRDHRAPPPERRSGGGYGFLLLLLWGMLGVIGWQLLTSLLGATVIPL